MSGHSVFGTGDVSGPVAKSDVRRLYFRSTVTVCGACVSGTGDVKSPVRPIGVSRGCIPSTVSVAGRCVAGTGDVRGPVRSASVRPGRDGRSVTVDVQRSLFQGTGDVTAESRPSLSSLSSNPTSQHAPLEEGDSSRYVLGL